MTELVAAGLRPGAKTEAFDPTVPVGLIVSQNPAPGVIVARDAAIDYVVSKGPEPTPIADAVTDPDARTDADARRPSRRRQPTPTPTPEPTPNRRPTPTRRADADARALIGGQASRSDHSDQRGLAGRRVRRRHLEQGFDRRAAPRRSWRLRPPRRPRRSRDARRRRCRLRPKRGHGPAGPRPRPARRLPSTPGSRRPGAGLDVDRARSSRPWRRPSDGSADTCRRRSRTGGRPSIETSPPGGSHSADSATSAWAGW